MASPSHELPLSKALWHEKTFLIRRDSGMISSERRFKRNLYMKANKRVMMRTLHFLVRQGRAKGKPRVI